MPRWRIVWVLSSQAVEIGGGVQHLLVTAQGVVEKHGQANIFAPLGSVRLSAQGGDIILLQLRKAYPKVGLQGGVNGIRLAAARSGVNVTVEG
jgi:hypothetical protein